MLISLLRTKVPGDESSRERRFQGTKVPENESSKERKFQGTKVPPMELSFLGTKVLGYESSMNLCQTAGLQGEYPANWWGGLADYWWQCFSLSLEKNIVLPVVLSLSG